MSAPLVPSEGVDEGSAASAVESAVGHEEPGVVGPAPRGVPARESDPAPGQVLETEESVLAPRTGQQLAAGEG